MLESDDITLTDVMRIAIAFGSTSYSELPLLKALLRILIPHVGQDKSFVDDLNMQRGIVSV